MTNRDADGPAASASLPHGACQARGEPAGSQVLDFRKHIILQAKYTSVGEKSLNVLLEEFNNYKY